jgi:small subunit ribosomal protein S17
MTTAKGKYGGRKVRDGTVVSDKMQKTVLVAVEEHIRHRLYKKRVKRMRRFMAHDEREESQMGDRVRIIEAAPISRRKRWLLVEVLQKAELPEVAAESIDLDLIGEVKREEEEPTAEAAETKPAKAAEAAETVDSSETVAAADTAETDELEPEEVSVEVVAVEEPAAEELDETPEAAEEEVAVAEGEAEANEDTDEAKAEEANKKSEDAGEEKE